MDDKTKVNLIKDSIRELYPKTDLDLSLIDDLYLAERALFLAETGLKAPYLIHALKLEKDNIRKSMALFNRLSFMRGFLTTAPRCYFKNSVKKIDPKELFIRRGEKV